jgi:predicted AlkP superfamily phosphohydrolase/phosphomutase
MPSKWEEMKDIAQNDLVSLIESEKSYGNSWKQRGGTGAFMMLARKFDRIEQQAKSVNWDIFEASHSYPGEEGVLDDIGDLRRYLLLVEHHVRFAEEPAGIEFQPLDEDE